MDRLKRYAKSLFLLGVVTIFVTGCGQERVNEAEIGVYYTDGPLEGEHFDRVLDPGQSAFVVNDHVYRLPARQITWITGPGDEADAPALEFTAAGGESMVMELSTRLYLNTSMDDNDEPFKTFFTGICQSFDCWDGSIENSPGADAGWNRMLKQLVGNPQRAAAIAVGLRYDAEQLRYDSAIQEEFADAFAEEFERLQADEVGVANIFCGPGYKRDGDNCPAVGVKVTRVTFKDDDREGIREERQLAERRQALAVVEQQTAAAEQLVNATRVTPQYIADQQVQAAIACANNPDGCNLTIILNGDDVSTTVNATP